MRMLSSTIVGAPADAQTSARLAYIETADYTAALERYSRLRTERGLPVNPRILADALLALQQHYALVVLGVANPVPTVGTDEILEAHLLADTQVFFEVFCTNAFGGPLHHIEGRDDTGERVRITRNARASYFSTVPGGGFAQHRPHGNDVICWGLKTAAAA